jgi:hypothetical protein
MVIYGLALTPLAASLRRSVPSVVQPWYADDAAMAGPVSGIAMRQLEIEGPARGYFPEPAKSILISGSNLSEASQEQLSEFHFKRHAGHRYVGSFIGTAEARQAWLEPQIAKWIRGIESLSRVARRFPQTAYAGLVKSLQMEWQYLQQVTPGAADSFIPVEEALHSSFIPALLEESEAGVAKLRALLQLSVRQAGMLLSPDM